jgi:hypothetical protein
MDSPGRKSFEEWRREEDVSLKNRILDKEAAILLFFKI